jgi:hypothetical protein
MPAPVNALARFADFINFAAFSINCGLPDFESHIDSCWFEQPEIDKRVE